MGWPGIYRFGGVVAFFLAVLVALDLANPPPLDRYRDQSVVVQAKDGSILRAFLSADDKWRLGVTSADVDPRYLSALKSFEDKRFDHHWGVDPLAIVRAVRQNLANGRIVSGASTLTMQTARLLEPGGRGWPAKLRQTVRALQLERRYTKDEILSIYLTLAPFGGNIEGVRAASLSYFRKEPVRLQLSEIALLVALPQSPERLRPDRHPDAARAAQTKVLARLQAELGVSAQAVAEALSGPPIARRHVLPFHAPHLAQRLKNWSAHKTIPTFVDGHVQRRLESLSRREKRWFGDGANMAMVVVHNATRQVRAYLGGADYWGPAGQVDLARAVRSPGSTLKPFIYGMAFDDMPLHPKTLIEDRPTLFGDYAPRNFNRNFQGTVTVEEALQWSLNVPAVALLDRLGPHYFHGRLARSGARLSYGGRHASPSLPLALGGVGMRLDDMTMLYASLADEGRVRPLAFAANDREEAPSAFRLMSQEASWYVGDILQGSPLPDGLAQGQGFSRGRPIAFKTGTSYGFRDAWAIGVSPAYTVGVWIGRADGSTRPGRFGRNEAAPVLMKVFDLLPTEEEMLEDPPATILQAANNSALPTSMRRFKPRPVLADRTVRAPLQVMFPPNGATVSLPETDGALALRSSGGMQPIHWLIDGKLVSDKDSRRRPSWRPDGEGFATVTAIDARGTSATSLIRLVAP